MAPDTKLWTWKNNNLLKKFYKNIVKGFLFLKSNAEGSIKQLILHPKKI